MQPLATGPPRRSTQPGSVSSSTSAGPSYSSGSSAQASSTSTSTRPSASTAASRAARPAPTRTLRQPLTLNVTERPPPARSASAVSASQQQPQPSDAALLRSALERRAQIARRADKWMDKAMEEVLDRSDFQKALSYMHAAQYAEVQHERHLNSLCAYPLCGNAPAAPYRAAKRFVVSTARRTITEKEGNDEQAFCGRRCAARSAWVAASLGTEAAWIRGKVAPLELLEDREARGEVRWGGKRGDVLEWVRDEPPAPAAEPAVAAREGTGEPRALVMANGSSQPPKQGPSASKDMISPTASQPITGKPSKPAPTSTPPEAGTPAATSRAPLPMPPLPTDSGMANLIASLSIVERETPLAAPAPPSLTSTTSGSAAVEPGAVVGAQPLPLPLPQGGVLASSSGAHHPAARRGRGGSSMVPASSSRIAAAVLSASRKIAPPTIGTGAPDSDDEGSASEEEWAKQMGWGGGPEVNALFNEARLARELMDKGEE